MRRALLFLAGCAVLVVAWTGGAGAPAPGPFSAHMVVHVLVVAVGAPLLAMAAGGTRLDPTMRWPALAAPVALMLAEFVVVWGWHAPTLHMAARTTLLFYVAEQAMFLGVGWVLWISVFGGRASGSRARAGVGVLAMLMTSMHMTLLGALITLAPRLLYIHRAVGTTAENALRDQQLAGMVMLFGGATVYLAAGLWLLMRLVRPPPEEEVDHAALG